MAGYRAPRGNQVHGTFPAGAYTPPAPTAIVGTFPVYVPVRRTLVATLSAPWRAAAGRDHAVAAPARGAVPVDLLASIKSPGASSVAADVDLPWPPSIVRDADPIAIRYAAYSARLAAVTVLPWGLSRVVDVAALSPWGAYSAWLASLLAGRWPGAVPADADRAGRWRGQRVPGWRLVDDPLHPADDIRIDVTGGGLRGRFPAGDYTPPAGKAVHGQFSAAPYTPPPVLWPGAGDMRVPWRELEFEVGPRRVPLLDEAGRPVMVSAIVDTHRQAPWPGAVDCSRAVRVPWLRYSRQLNPGWGVVVPPGPVTPEPGQQIVIPVKRTYIVVNEIYLLRVADSALLDPLQLSVTVDCDSWVVSWSASVPFGQRDLVWPGGEPVVLLAGINGYEFSLRVEKAVLTRQFGQRAVAISGRGVAAELGAELAPLADYANATAMTAQQLVDAALEFTGYDQAWEITDWLVPAGTLNLRGAPADVARHVAEAAGAVLQASWSSKRLRMLPRYPVLPWDWSTAEPDIIIPAAVSETDSVEYVEKPEYNLVYVSGEQTGVLGRVKRAGSAGDKPAPMVTHPLITHADAARQHGGCILADTGQRSLLQVTLPVLEESGIIDVCLLAEFSDGLNTRRGITRANTITASLPVVRQTLTIEATA